MQATSTPTLAQPKSGAFAALGGAVILAAAVGAGAIIGVNLASSGAATAGNDANVAAYALGVQRNGEIGALTPAQRGLVLQRKGEIALGAVTPKAVVPVEIMPKSESTTFTTPTGTVVRIGGRDGQAAFNQAPLVSAYDLIRGSRGWYAFAPAGPAILSADDAQRAANGWMGTTLTGKDLYPAVPFVVSDEQTAPYPGPMYPPAAPAEGNTQSVGISHR